MENGKKLIRQVLATVIAGLIIQVLVVGGIVIKMSYSCELTNKYQSEQIKDIKQEQKEMKRDIKDQYYALNKSINELKEKLK